MFLILFLLTFNLNYVICDEQQGLHIQKIFDDSTITVSLEKYNVSNPDGESIDFLYSLPPNSSFEINLTDIPNDVYFTVVQVHSYFLNVTLSYNEILFSNNSITGTNIGLLKVYKGQDLSFYLFHNNSLDFVDVMIAVQAYKDSAPIPGGCNMEFPVEISPFLQTVYNDGVTEVDFAPSSPPLSNFSFPSAYMDGCNIKPSQVEHQMYHRYFPERDFSKETYFYILKSMLTKGRILNGGVFIPEKLTGPTTKRFFASYPGTGHVFVVLTTSKYDTSAYVPSVVYGCSDLADDNTCAVLTTTFSRILCASILFLGLFACFIGHNCFRFEIFLFGFLVSGKIAYILVSLSFSQANVLTTSVSIGLATATVMLLLWTIFGLPIISLILASLAFGFLFASLVLFFITDLIDSLILDINFWGIFIGIVASCPVLMLCLSEKANIISCAFLGSYVAIMSIDYYIGSNLRFIVLNTIRRAVVDNFNMAIIDPPFQWRDIFLSIIWLILSISGILLQRRLMRDKPPYPPPLPHKVIVSFRSLRRVCNKWHRVPTQPDERTALWGHSTPNSVPYYAT